MTILLVFALIVFGAVFLLAFQCAIVIGIAKFFIGLFKFCYGLSKGLLGLIILILLIALVTLL